MKPANSKLEGPRGTRPDEISCVMKLIGSIFALNWKKGMYECFPVLFADDNLENCRIALDGDRPVCHIGYLVRDAVIRGTTIRTGSIGAVCTDPEYRGRGIATTVMNDCEQRMREAGVDVEIISGGRGLYVRRGARSVSEQVEFVLTKDAAAKLADDSMEVKEGGVNDIPTLAALYESNAAYHVRSNTDWERWLQSRQCENAESRPLIGYLGGEAVAYVVQQCVNRQQELISSAAEWAGNAQSVAKVLASILLGGECEDVRLAVDRNEFPELIARLTDAGLDGKVTHHGRTIKVLSPAALFDKLRPLFPTAAREVHVMDAEEGARFKLGGDAIDLPVEEVARVFFGDPEGAVPKKLAAAGKLGKALLESFPVPLPRYGYNFI